MNVEGLRAAGARRPRASAALFGHLWAAGQSHGQISLCA